MNEIKTAEQEQRIAKAKAKLRVAELRVRACEQEQYVNAYLSQASRAESFSFRDSCERKAREASAYATRARAEADLLEAEAGL